MESPQEQSAYGLSTAEGVIVLRVWNQSPAVLNDGIKKGDVILEASGEKVVTVKDFFRINAQNKSNTLELVIMRNQSEIKITINTK